MSGLLSLLGLLTLLLGLVLMLVLKEIRLAAWGILVVGVALMATAVVLDFRKVSGAVTGRRGRFSAGTTVMTSIFIGITLLINAISIGSYQRFDTTGLSQFTLTSQTKDVLAEVSIPVRVFAFFVPNDAYGIQNYASNLLEEYKKYTDKLTVKVIDPDEHPDQANVYGITQYQTVVFESDIGRRLVSPQDMIQTDVDSQGNPQIVGLEAEHAFTSALLEVTGVTQKKIYFLSGHGESSIDGDYSIVKQGLLDNLYKVGTLDLLISHEVPSDAAGLIIAGPQKAISADEIGIINAYLENGGWVMLLLNPNPSPDVNQLLFKWGLTTKSGTMVDPDSFVGDTPPNISKLLIPRLRNFFGYTEIFLPGATALLPQPGFEPQAIPGPSSDAPIQVIWSSENSSLQLYSIARTSQGSWLENNYTVDSNPAFDENSDTKGSLDVGFFIFMSPPTDSQGNPIGSVPDTRFIVLGDSDFASNQNFLNGSNGDLFLNLVELLTTGKQLVSIERKVLPFRRLIVGPEASTFIMFSSIVLPPLLVLITGGIIWWRRR